MSITYELIEKIPTVEEYQYLRNAVGWSKVNDAAVDISLKNSLYSVCLYYNNQIIGMGRIIGDTGIYYYIQDVMVLPHFQRKGLGKKIMNLIIKYLIENVDSTAFIGLMAAKGFWKFYENYGFQKRASDAPGMFVNQVQKLRTT
ncbi:GNAT family N-acetyltransferase [Candidatus Hodarchaeum mangrovi]|nr:GNAT family N-acetyltransferase [Asgard group archaeon]